MSPSADSESLRDLNVESKRKPSSKEQWKAGVPYDASMFKTQDQRGKPVSRVWDHRLTAESILRTDSSLKASAKYLREGNVVSLGGGWPRSEYFPFESLQLTSSSIESLDSHMPELSKNHTIAATKQDILEGRSVFDLSVALNYGQGCGAPQLVRWIVEHTEMVHDPPYANWQCAMTIGNTSALDMVLRMLTQAGDAVLCEQYTFSSAIEAAKPMGVNFVGIDMDEEGILPDSLAAVLDNWDTDARSARKPFLLYIVPTGQNPTGATQGLQRRKNIYEVAQRHDLIMLEDDPYYWLQMDGYTHNSYDPKGDASECTPSQLLEMIVPSYLKLDVDGRVIRMDSFSKVVSPGLRVGWITATDQIIDRYKRHSDVSTQSPSGVSQLLLFKLLDEQWGHSGYLRWLLHIRNEYTRRRNYALGLCERYLPREVVSWAPTEAGMFQWLRVDWRKHPNAGLKSVDEIEEEVWTHSIGQGVLTARGGWFFASAETPRDEAFLRITFAAATFEELGLAIQALGKSLRTLFKIDQ